MNYLVRDADYTCMTGEHDEHWVTYGLYQHWEDANEVRCKMQRQNGRPVEIWAVEEHCNCTLSGNYT